MHFFDDSLLPENQEKLVIQVAPYGPEWLPQDSDDIPVSMDAQVQKAVDCYNAGATVLHVHVREADGKGSKRISTFNELLARLRIAVPKMLLQVGDFHDTSSLTKLTGCAGRQNVGRCDWSSRARSRISCCSTSLRCRSASRRWAV